MKDKVIFCDSCSSITKEMAKQLDVTIIPTLFTMEGFEYNPLEDTIIPNEEFYKKLENKIYCKTSCINPDTFISYFEEALKEGKDVLYVALSSGLSASYNNAVLAQQILASSYENTVEIIDTKNGSLGVLLTLNKTIDMINEGKSVTEVKNALNNNAINACAYFTIGSLDHLRRGGRLSTLSAVLGTILHINPIIKASPEGKLVEGGKFRGRKKAIQAMLDTAIETASPTSIIYIGHTNATEEAQAMKEYLLEHSQHRDVRLAYIDHTMSAHCGPKTLAIFYEKK